MSLPKRSSQSDYSLDPAESTHDPQRIRAVRLDVCLANWGSTFRLQEELLSVMLQILILVRWWISLTTFLAMIGRLLVLTSSWHWFGPTTSGQLCLPSAIVSCLVGVLRIYFPGNHWWPVCFGYLAFAFTLCFWQRMRSCCCKPPKAFLDRLCIPQDDEILKRQGALLRVEVRRG